MTQKIKKDVLLPGPLRHSAYSAVKSCLWSCRSDEVPPPALGFRERSPAHFFEYGIEFVKPETGNTLFPVDAVGLPEYAQVLLLPADRAYFQMAEG
jgi:hypothetical protein